MSDKELLDIRELNELIRSLDLADNIVYKKYLSHLNQMEVIPCPDEIQKSDLNDFVRYYKIERFIYEKNENNRDKLVSIFHAVASCGGSVIVIINSDGEKVNYYFGAKVNHDAEIAPSADVLKKSLSGNFPGTKTSVVSSGSALDKLTDSIFKNRRNTDEKRLICTVTGVPGFRAKEESHEKLFIQGMEKLVDSMRGETYSLLLIADPVLTEELQIIKKGYEILYTQLVPFAGSELTFGHNDNVSISNSITKGLSKSINESVTDTLTHTKGTSESHTNGTSKTKGASTNLGFAGGLAGAAIGTLIAPGIGTIIGGIIGGAAGGSTTLNSSTTNSESHTSGTNESTAIALSTMRGITNTISEQEGLTGTKGEGTNRGIQLKYENKAVKNLLEKIDLQLKRIDESSDIGMWNCSAYCFADNPSTCKMVASSYQSLLRGENSSIETGIITEWTKENTDKILPWLEKMHHPCLLLEEKAINPTSFISGNELAIYAGIPQSSVGGLPVIQMAPFGREVSPHWQSGKIEQYGSNFPLGKINHMGSEEDLTVMLNKNSLASHTFITGSTGSGKSNTVYTILNEISQLYVKFLIIEPAKGEYKNVFGSKTGVNVYGTNPELTDMLQINPFKFPTENEDPSKNIHILEHLDRLVEIFNVCWPMYAAMPAVLKEAIEVSYEKAGWNLQTSKNKYPQALYPSFSDVVENIREIIDSSDYSNENKGNYKGSLITRLKSLTNGINGLIFTDDELGNAKLFDENVIVDLSRVGSMETKALIMGILVMKLHEYRLTSGKMNDDLRHITVLEEAHNLLKRTSTEQSDESSNLLGKSVEMLANAIAEMRTYGEGFIIADQSPGLLDMSVIRNTNTKIILRLPDESDRELVGKAASLNDDQITELARLQCGVAAVFQNDWIQPVLCKVNYFKTPEELYAFNGSNIYKNIINDADLVKIKKRIIKYLLSLELEEKTDEDVIELKKIITEAPFNSGLKVKLFEILLKKEKSGLLITGQIISKLFEKNQEIFLEAERFRTGNNYSNWEEYMKQKLVPSINDLSYRHQTTILQCVIQENCRKDAALSDIPAKYSAYSKSKGELL